MDNGESGTSSIGDGRYELRDPYGESAGARLWSAYDTRVRRDVVVTAIPRRLSDPYTVKSRTALVKRLSSPAIARILDEFDDSETSYVVAERRGTAPVSAERSARDVAAALLPLASATEQAHQNGVTLSLDDPVRVRVDDTGSAYLAFPAPALHHDPAADVRGLGGLLQSLVATVPATDSGRGELDTLAARATNGSVATAGALVQVLERIGSGAAAPTTPMVAPPPASQRGVLAQLDDPRKRKLALWAGAIVLVLLVAWVAALFIADDSDFPTKTEDSVTTSSLVPSSTTTTTASTTTTIAEATSPPVPAPPPVTVQPQVTTAPVTTVPQPPATTQDAPGVRPCYPGYSHQPPPDGPCLPVGNTQTVTQNPAPAPTQTPGVLPCYPGYSHQPPPNGPCLPAR